MKIKENNLLNIFLLLSNIKNVDALFPLVNIFLSLISAYACSMVSFKIFYFGNNDFLNIQYNFDFYH